MCEDGLRKNKSRKIVKDWYAFTGCLVIVLAFFAFWGTAIWAVWYFIRKYW